MPPLVRRPIRNAACFGVTCGAWLCMVVAAAGQERQVDSRAVAGAPINAASTEHAVVVCPSRFRDAVTPWLLYRQSQGVRVTVIDSNASARQLGDDLGGIMPRPTSILLVGDAPAIGTAANPQRHVPMHYVATTVSAKFGSTPTLATDLPYGDLDGDGICDAAVGRLPVDTPEQLTSLIKRIESYESSQDFSTWRDQVQLVGGVGGFGMLADAAIESVTRLMVTASLPTSVRTSVAYGSPGHLFYPRKRFTEWVTNRYNKGCRFWVYAGHGLVEELDRVPAAESGIPVLDKSSLKNLQCEAGRAPIALLLCCFTGAIDAGVDSFAEDMLRHEGGPIAVIAGNRVTMPYGNATLTLGLVDAIYGDQDAGIQPAPRLGDAWLSALRQLRTAPQADQTQLRTMIDSVAALVSPAGTKLDEERAEHSMLYSLLGDPMLRMHPPAAIHLQTQSGFDFGEPVEVTVRCPIDGQCVVMVDHPLGVQLPSSTSSQDRDPNELTLAKLERLVRSGNEETFLIKVPGSRSGLVNIRVHVEGEGTWAAGGAKTIIRPKN